MTATLHDVEKFIEQNPDDCDVGEPISPELIDKAERFLGMQFPTDYRECLRRWGTLSIGAMEYYGICGEDFENASVPDAVGYTNRKRKNGFPKNLLILYDKEGDEYWCLEPKSLTEYRIVAWECIYNEISYVKSNSLFEFILEEAEDWF